MRCPARVESGFTLVEVLVASALIVSVAGGFAHLAAAGVARSNAARSAGVALALAQGKLEELRAAPWSYDAAGLPASDPALTPSPDDSLTSDRDGWFDALDRFGGGVPVEERRRAVFGRRWSVSRFEPGDGDTLILRVCVRSMVLSAAAGAGAADACVSAVMTRKP